MKKEFRSVPSEKAVYEVQEGCCYTKVVYEGPGMGIYPRLDRHNEVTGILLCHCDPKKEIKPITYSVYQAYYDLVRQQAAKA